MKNSKKMRPIIVKNGNVLQNGQLAKHDVFVDNGFIASSDCADAANGLILDATDLYVLPGIVDVHGDAFERQIMPRSGVSFDLQLAMQDTDLQLASNGITTAFHGLTISWEPGLRSLNNARQFMTAIKSMRAGFSVDHRAQLRWETFALNAVADVEGWLCEQPTPALAFNDHTTSTIKRVEAGNKEKLAGWAARCNLSPEDYVARVYEVAAKKEEVPRAVERLALVAREQNTAILSHDDVTKQDRTFYRSLGGKVAEFPMTMEALNEAKEAGEHTVFGAPNVVRGGSHNGALNATEMIKNGLCSILASDYHYPSLLQAAFKLVAENDISLGDAWALISKNPAKAMGLADRGTLDNGKRADILLVDAHGTVPKPVATICGGKLVSLADDALLLIE
ncbi:alpha-D-ribose 1-methylphosphonate 5-triphosphate diphosphatase [Maritalea sp.]|uniref:alpha-D-ribose 1-methylphosphonate 5-triphosphate diphosphatase n=1 Tax=Maritalea sp. TaxID=2003361 RepID=UPI003EFA4650